MPCTDETITLQRIVRSDASVLANLFELYVHDFSEFVALSIKENGRFDLPLGDAWWNAATHHAFFIRVEARLAGFALARVGSQVSARRDVMDVAEFFVLRGERRRHVGLRAALELLRSFPSAWEIRVRTKNAPALAFWARVAESHAGERCASRLVTQGDVELTVLDVPSRG